MSSLSTTEVSEPGSSEWLRPVRRGAVLILVLAVLAMLSLLAFGLCHRLRLELKTSRAETRAIRGRYLAIAGVSRALAAIRQDRDEAIDHFGEPWHLVGDAASEGLFSREDRGPEGGGGPSYALSYAVLDEESRLNINTSSPAAWLALPGMSEPLVCAIVDWQDADEWVTGTGAETTEYERKTPSYRAKNRPMSMIWELALVQGVNWRGLLGEDVNGTLALEENEDDGAVSWPADDGDRELDRGLMEFFTVYGNGKVNLNTASVEVLSALPGIGPVVAQAIVSWRLGSDGQAFTADDRFLQKLDQLIEIPGVGEREVELLKEYGVLCSRHFRIYVEAVAASGARPCRVLALARREKGEIRLVWLRWLS